MSGAKILVIGPGEAGKSTLIGALCANALNLAVGGRTVALDHGTVVRGGRRATLIGVPGQPRFAPVRAALARGLRAAIWVHPHGSDPDAETVALLASDALRALPYLVVVNRRAPPCDGDGFSPPAELARPREILILDLLAVSSRHDELVDALFRLVDCFPPEHRG